MLSSISVAVGARGASRARELATSRAVVGAVALFASVLNTIAAARLHAVTTASIGSDVRVVVASIAFLIAFNNAITANSGLLEP